MNAVKKAAEDNEIVGAFYISTPDFELQNFTTNELWQIIREINDSPIDPKHAPTDDQLNACESARDFFKLIHDIPGVSRDINKGRQWGEQLIRYAQKHPVKDGTEGERPILSAMKKIYGASRYHYQFSLKVRVEPNTGQLVKRE